MSLKKNLAYNLALSLSGVLFPLLSIPWLSRVLSPEGLGRVQSIDSLTYYFIVLAEAGIVTHAIREVSRCRRDPALLRQTVSELLSLHLVTTLLSACLFGAAVYLLYARIGDPRLLLFSFSFLLVNGFACEWYFWGTESFRYITLRSLLVRGLALLGLFLLVRRPEHYLQYYALITGSAIATLLVNVSRMLRETGFSWERLSWKRHLRVTRITYGISLMYSVPLLLDNVLLGVISGAAAVPVYAYAVKVVRLLSALITDAFLVLYPRTVSLLHEAEADLLRRNIRLSADGLLLISIPAAAGLWLVADPLAGSYFGPQYAAVAENLKILALLPPLLTAALFLNKQVLLPRNGERWVLIGLTAGALVFCGMAFRLCPVYGARGMAAALVTGELTVLIANAVFARRIYPGTVPLPLRSLGLSILIAALFFGWSLLLRQVALPPGLLLAALLIGAAAIFFAVLKLARLEVSELFFNAIRAKLRSSRLDARPKP